MVDKGVGPNKGEGKVFELLVATGPLHVPGCNVVFLPGGGPGIAFGCTPQSGASAETKEALRVWLHKNSQVRLGQGRLLRLADPGQAVFGIQDIGSLKKIGRIRLAGHFLTFAGAARYGAESRLESPGDCS